ncbi:MULTISPECIES: LysR family transcriptional regulator [unclassified Sinorhizobium]|uniref:LysR family transcriptional regulator n=1 Tax=unclassified Sinorhizobium TaxID=2613772 RepID=UPI003525D5D5
MPNLLEETPGLLAFVRTVETGSFSAAARDLKTTPSGVSRSVARVEEKIGTRLFLRSTRALTLTADGHAFFERVAPLLKEIEAAGDVISTECQPSGRLKISLPSELARILMEPLLSKFVKPNPALHLDIGMTDRYVDLIREGYDVAFRVGHSPESELISRKLANLDMVLVASPAFIEREGEPKTIAELACLPFVRYTLPARPFEIRFSNGTLISPAGVIDCDSGFALQAAALQGMGIAYLLKCVVADDLRRGRLVQVLPREPLPSLPLNALHAFGRTVPAKVRLLCDFIAQEVRALV